MVDAPKKQPALPMMIGDYFKDPLLGQASLLSRGVWYEILMFMWEGDRRGEIITTPIRLMGLVRCRDIDEILFFFNEIMDIEFGYVEFHKNVNSPLTLEDCNTKVTLRNRRMHSEFKDRQNTRLRVQKHREKKGVTQKKHESNSDVTPSLSVAVAITKDLSKDKSPSGNHFKDKMDGFLEAILDEIKLIYQYPQNGKPVAQKTLFQWVQEKTNKSGHPEAIYKSLNWLQTCLKDGEAINSFRAFAEKTFMTVNPQFNSRDAEAESEAFKKAVIENEDMKKILRGIG